MSNPDSKYASFNPQQEKHHAFRQTHPIQKLKPALQNQLPPEQDGILLCLDSNGVTGDNAKYMKMYNRLARWYDFGERWIARLRYGNSINEMRRSLMGELEWRQDCTALYVSIGTGTDLNHLPASSSVGVWMWAKSARLMPKRFYKPDHIGAMPVPLPRKKPNRMFISPSGSRKRLLRKPPASTALKPMSAVSAAARFFASSSSAARNT